MKSSILSTAVVALFVLPELLMAQSSTSAPCKAGDRFIALALEGTVVTVWPDHIKVRPDGAERYDLVTVPLPFGTRPYVWPTPTQPAYGTAKPTPKPASPGLSPDPSAKCVPASPPPPDPAMVRGSGIRELTNELLQTAMAATDDQISSASTVAMVQLKVAAVSGSAAPVQRYTDTPFFVTISSPWVRAASAAAEARRRFEPAPQLSVEKLNAEGVTVIVSPGRLIMNADAIENVVLKRGDDIIRPIEAHVEPTTIETAAGVKRELSRGRFKFPMSALTPEVATTIVCIGARGNYEFPLTPLELSHLK